MQKLLLFFDIKKYTVHTYVCNNRMLEKYMRGLPKHVKEKVEAEKTK